MKARLASAKRPTAFAMSVAAAVSLVFASAAAADDYPAVTYERLTAAQSDPGWLTYYRTYNGQAHSPLKQLDTTNVKNLKQVWSYKFPADLQQGFEATPIVNGRFLFVTTPKDNVYAFDAVTGKQLWKFEPKLGAESFKTACCDVINRGVALYGKNVYVAMLSGDVVALGRADRSTCLAQADVRAGSGLRVLARAARTRRRSSGGQRRRRIWRARFYCGVESR
jgi:Glucose dehydrogenase